MIHYLIRLCFISKCELLKGRDFVWWIHTNLFIKNLPYQSSTATKLRLDNKSHTTNIPNVNHQTWYKKYCLNDKPFLYKSNMAASTDSLNHLTTGTCLWLSTYVLSAIWNQWTHKYKLEPIYQLQIKIANWTIRILLRYNVMYRNTCKMYLHGE